MAIEPPSDIVLDVARAADPARFQMASAKLSEGARPADPATFDQAMQVASAEPLIAGGFDSYSARNTIKNAVQSVETDRSKPALQQFESFVLQTFIESMLPKNSENTYGKGNTGAI
jgi:flagellar protein FlgJ